MGRLINITICGVLYIGLTFISSSHAGDLDHPTPVLEKDAKECIDYYENQYGYTLALPKFISELYDNNKVIRTGPCVPNVQPKKSYNFGSARIKRLWNEGERIAKLMLQKNNKFDTSLSPTEKADLKIVIIAGYNETGYKGLAIAFTLIESGYQNVTIISMPDYEGRRGYLPEIDILLNYLGNLILTMTLEKRIYAVFEVDLNNLGTSVSFIEAKNFLHGTDNEPNLVVEAYTGAVNDRNTYIATKVFTNPIFNFLYRLTVENTDRNVKVTSVGLPMTWHEVNGVRSHAISKRFYIPSEIYLMYFASPIIGFIMNDAKFLNTKVFIVMLEQFELAALDLLLSSSAPYFNYDVVCDKVIDTKLADTTGISGNVDVLRVSGNLRLSRSSSMSQLVTKSIKMAYELRGSNLYKSGKWTSSAKLTWIP